MDVWRAQCHNFEPRVKQLWNGELGPYLGS